MPGMWTLDNCCITAESPKYLSSCDSYFEPAASDYTAGNIINIILTNSYILLKTEMVQMLPFLSYQAISSG